jgi:hypothetical protein
VVGSVVRVAKHPDPAADISKGLQFLFQLPGETVRPLLDPRLPIDRNVTVAVANKNIVSKQITNVRHWSTSSKDKAPSRKDFCASTIGNQVESALDPYPDP